MMVWLDWCFYAYIWEFLGMVLLATLLSCWYFPSRTSGITHVIIGNLVGFCVWVVYCFMQNGIGIG